MTQDELKQRVAQAALDYVQQHVADGAVLGIGTGSTVNFFIDALAPLRGRYRGAVSSSAASTRRLEAHGIAVLGLGEIDSLPVYVDGADEIDGQGNMIKGGGGALTREKIVADAAVTFVCIADGSKQVDMLGAFPLPIEVIPMARPALVRKLAALGGTAAVRTTAHGTPFVTDNGNEILDVRGLRIADPRELEDQINGWPGVVTVGLFAHRGANVCLLGRETGVERLDYQPR
jgi:ribose 5-phosphate isomerase A